MNSRGLTLLEVLITLAILSVLMLFANRSIQSGIASKVKIQEQVDQMGRLRDALRIMEKDINLAFHYRDIETELQTEVKKLQKSGANVVPTLKPDRSDPTTNFIGNGESMVFPSMNSSRMNEGARQADFIKVGYALRSCKKLNDKKGSGQCLIRSTSTVVEGDLTKVKSEDSVLLENVTEFKLRYIGKGKQDWNSDWDTNGQDGASKANFPQAVEISITLENGDSEKGKTKKYSMQIVANVHFLNNKAETNTTTAPGGVGP